MKLAFRLILAAMIGLTTACQSGVMTDSPLDGLDPALVGTWQGTAESPMGTLPLTAQFAADGTYSVTTPMGTNYGTFSTDNTQSPAWINVHNQHGQTWKGLYEISGNTLRWSEAVGNRPASLDSAAYRYTLTRSS
ncbi:MAG: hypothetical protein AMXMBFR13_14220 [Phycisphaerae bacterium]